MHAAVITKQGTPVASHIRAVRDWPELPPTPPGYAQIRVEATALNHMDLWVGKGLPGADLDYPRISGCDVCGVVESVAPDVDSSWVGKRVMMNAATPLRHKTRPDEPTAASLAPSYHLIGEQIHGAHRERFHAPVTNLVHVPDADPKQAAAFGLTFLTAYSMMFTKAGLKPGQTVLVTGIGGGVALAALALAKWHGCFVCVTSRHQWKLDRAMELGADAAALDTGEDWSREARSATAKRGFDLAVDSAGKATHLNCIKSLARGGAYVTPGCTSGPDATTDLARIFWNQLRIFGSTMGTNDEFREVVALFRAGLLAPVIDSVYPWAEAADAWARLESAEQFGKVVIDWTV